MTQNQQVKTTVSLNEREIRLIRAYMKRTPHLWDNESAFVHDAIRILAVALDSKIAEFVLMQTLQEFHALERAHDKHPEQPPPPP